jgi:hypothetical protein
MKRSVLLGVFLVLVSVSLAFAQGKPNFSGKWTPQEAAAGGGGGRGMMAGPMTLTQTANDLTVEREGRNGVQKTVYKLDGSETTSEGRGGTQVTTAKWDGNKLVITTKMETQNGPRENVQTWYMEGSNLVIERPGRGGGEAMKTVFTKG